MVREDDIRIRSFALWEAAGRPDGQDIEFWLRAEAELGAEIRYSAKPWMQLAASIVPRVPVFVAPRRIAAIRVPARERRLTVSAAMR
jgi:hypothetical protein